MADGLEVEDDGAGRRVGRSNSLEQVVLEQIGVGEDQFRFEAMDQYARTGVASGLYSRSTKRPPSLRSRS
ncbi:MAG TPA: hypothetical protein VFZ00_35315 [Solirubrobacter sp.]|nr:hypothetical protein [Solirubrobacter sp.]